MVISIVGARTGLRVVLDSKHRLMAMLKRRNGAVVEIEMGDLNHRLRPVSYTHLTLPTRS